LQKKRQPDHAYMTVQSDINSKMRAILVDWLVDVHYKYALLPQTLHIAVLLIDRFLEKNQKLKRQKLQLVGVTAMFVAAKYEEIYPPEAEDFVKITDNAYTREELFGMERELLAGIKYRVTFPTAYQFMKRFVKAARTKDDRVEHFAHYVIDRSLQEIKLLKYTPSLVAAAAVHIAKTQMGELPAWVRPSALIWSGVSWL
jgi:transcription initiation factor TFIIIB Brf1 subunit/transcription initiation factor TFIIB